MNLPMFRMFGVNRVVLAASLCLTLPCAAVSAGQAQTASAAPRQIGTVKSMDGSTLKLTTAKGDEVLVVLAPDAAVLQLPPGSTDLKAALPAAAKDISVGDRVLVNGTAGDTPASLHGVRVVMMKSNDIAARKAAQQADWQRNGTGGLVRGIDATMLTVSAGARTLKVQTTPQTIFKRYADDSVSFEDAKPGTLDQIRTGDQISVRGAKSEDGASIAAAEVVTGTFQNLSGAVSSVNASAGTVTLKDLISKRVVTIHVTANSDLRKLPPQAAAMFAQRGNSGGGGTGGGTAAGAPAGGTAPTGSAGQSGPGGRAGAGAPGSGLGTPGSGAVRTPGGPGAAPDAGGRRTGMDLSRMLARLPADSLAEIKPGEAVMIVASQDGTGPDSLTAITLLSGVEALLTAGPGAQPITLSPWNLGVPEGGGGGPQ